MIDGEIKENLKLKIEEGTFGPSDIATYLDLFCQMGNELKEIQALVHGWGLRIFLDFQGSGSFWIIIDNGHFTCGSGSLNQPELTLIMDANQAALIFSGAKDAQASFLAGELQVVGQLPDALKLNALIESISEEIEY